MADMMIPEGWKNKTLDEVATVFAGGTPSRSNQAYYDGGIPWVKSGEVNKRFVYYTEETISELAVQESSARWAKSSSVLIAMYGATAGKVAKLMIDATLNQAVSAINGKSKMANNDFLFYAIENKSQELLNTVQGSGQPNLSGALIKSLNLAIPPLPEQQKIATIITSVDTVIEKTRAQIDKLKHLKTGMMQQLLTKGIGHTEFKDTPVGRIPKAWGVATLGSMLKEKPQYGANASATPYMKGSPRYLRITDILDDGSLDQSSPVGICPDESNGYYLKKDDLVIARTGNTVGKSYIHTGDFDLVYAGYLIKFVADKKRIFPRFLFWITQSKSYQDWLKSMMRVGAQPNINAAEYSSMLIAIPSLEEQADINAALDGVQNRIRISEHKNKQMSNLKKSLMQDLLTGKIRTI